MRPERIFLPVVVLALWTGVVLMMTGGRRLWAVRRGLIHSTAFRQGESADVPPEVAIVNRNLMNLLEMPLLFYVVALSFFVTRHVNQAVLTMSWLYVGLRLVHSAIHLSYNRVFHRFFAFASSNIVLLFLWVAFLRRVLGS